MFRSLIDLRASSIVATMVQPAHCTRRRVCIRCTFGWDLISSASCSCTVGAALRSTWMRKRCDVWYSASTSRDTMIAAVSRLAPMKYTIRGSPGSSRSVPTRRRARRCTGTAERARLLPCRALDRALAALLKRAHVIIGADHIEPVVIDQRVVGYQRKRRLLNRRVWPDQTAISASESASVPSRHRCALRRQH